MWSLADPLWLLLLPLPLLVARLLPPTQGEDGTALLVPPGLGRRLRRAGGEAGWQQAERGLPALAWIALVLALAGPQRLLPNLAAPTSGREIVLALDVSGSMVERDFSLDGETVSRLDAVKRVASDFLRGRGGDRLAVVLFGSKAYFATPQTYDFAAAAQAVEEAVIGISGRATNIGDAIGLTLRRLRNSDAEEKTLILLSDGASNSGPVRPRDAAALAKAQGVRIHTIAMGPNEVGDDSGARDAVDVATLNAIANLSGGTAFRVRSTEDLRAVAEEIDRIEANDRDGPAAELHRGYWPWPASVALLSLVLVATGLPGRRG